MRSESRTTLAAGVAAAKVSNPALLAAAISVVEAELTRKQAIVSDFAPVLDAFARYEDETREGSRFGGGSQTRDTTYGVRLTVPIFNASGQGLQTTLRAVDLRSATLDYCATRRQLRAQVLARPALAIVVNGQRDIQIAITLDYISQVADLSNTQSGYFTLSAPDILPGYQCLIPVTSN